MLNLEFELNPRASVPDFQRHVDADARLSAAAREVLRAELDVRYGPGPLQTLDVFPAKQAKAPTHIFIHGGYWRALDKNFYSFIAATLAETTGATVVVPNYDLCPSVTLDEIVSEIVQCGAWLLANISRYNGDAQSITVSGHSAGAHLAAMLMKSMPDAVKGACLISGIYDLRQVRKISVNADVRLDESAAIRNSPMLSPPVVDCEIEVLVGGKETTLWRKQSYDFWRVCTEVGTRARYLEVPDEDHFSITGCLDRASNPVAQVIKGQILRSRVAASRRDLGARTFDTLSA
ncbi:MAG: alpha/beta hydrolase [Rubrivivax sp.]